MKKYYLLDTNVIAELLKSVPKENVVRKIIDKREFSSIPSVTWAEALYGVKRMPEGHRRNRILDFYLNSVAVSYDFISFDEHAATVYSDIKSRLDRIGRPTPEIDLQIAAIAIANNYILITRNIRDFEDIQKVSNLMLEDWFSL